MNNIVRIKNASYPNKISELYWDTGINSCRNITFMVTDDCPCECTYCYQINKGHRMMSKETAKKIIDNLFLMYEEDDPKAVINKTVRAIILDFIGGEPLMNIEVIDYACSYFMEKCLELDHPWALTWRASMISNGALYFKPEVQDFLRRFDHRISFGITIDGPKHIHDSCRIYHDGRGNFDDAYAAFQHFNKNFYFTSSTKVTIAPENLKDIGEIVRFFVNDGVKEINANPIFEHPWTLKEASHYYEELKKIADYLLEQDDPEIYFRPFHSDWYKPLPVEENKNWCGGTGAMIAYDPDGVAYPCIRYMESSLGTNREPIKIGNVDRGIYKTEKEKRIFDFLESITRKSQSTEECFNCSIAQGCSWCSAYNYQETGSANKRSTNICHMHEAASLAHAYYVNKYFRNHNMTERMPIYLEDDRALKIISQEELNMLKQLEE